MKEKNTLGGIFLVALSAAAFGFGPIFAKMAYAAGMSTYSLLFLRFTAAAAFMFLLLRASRKKLPAKRDAGAYFLLGAVGFGGQSFCFFTALNHASSSVVSLLLYTYPALVMLGSVLFLKEKVSARKVIALLFALAGAFIIVGAEFEANPRGIVFALLAALVNTVYIMVSARVIKAGESAQSSAFIMLGAALSYALLNLLAGFAPPVRAEGYVALGLIALVSTVVAFWSFFAGMERTGPTTAALVSTLEPVVTVLASVAILAEPITVNVILGGCLVLMALVTTALPEKNAP